MLGAHCRGWEVAIMRHYASQSIPIGPTTINRLLACLWPQGGRCYSHPRCAKKRTETAPRRIDNAKDMTLPTFPSPHVTYMRSAHDSESNAQCSTTWAHFDYCLASILPSYPFCPFFPNSYTHCVAPLTRKAYVPADFRHRMLY